MENIADAAAALTMRAIRWLVILLLAGCVYQNPNRYQYGWRPPASADERSYLGFDPDYEQSLLERYIASHRLEVARFRHDQLGWRD